MFSSEIYHNFQTARKQKTLPAAAGSWTRDLRVTRSTLYQLSYTVRRVPERGSNPQPGAHIRKKFGGVSYVLGPTFVVFVFGNKSQLL